jgi:microcystin degradation protein MlrC
MRVAVGQLWQESNTFNPLPTTRLDFEHHGVLRGAEVVRHMAETNELGGFIQALRAWPGRPEVIGLVRLPAWPGGPATRRTFDWIVRELLDAVGAAGPLDGVLLALHGALVSEDVPDVEGAVLGAVREAVGPRVPVVATLDLHANVTAAMARAADALVLYHTAPHTDVFETGTRAAAVLRRVLAAGARPVTAFQKLPLVVPAERANTQDPESVSYDFRLRLEELERQPGVLAAGLATVQPWLDVPDLGAAVVVVTDNDPDLARRCCAVLAAELWRRRHDYLPELLPPGQAVLRAHAHREGLVVLGDGADATTSGAPGDGTWLLRELLAHDWPRPALVPLVAPEVVTEAARRGVGETFTTPLGGVRDRRFSRPVTVTARVERLFEARFVLSGHLGRNLPVDMGPAAVLRVGNVHIVVTSRPGPHFAPELFRAAGLDPFAASVLVAKSPCGFRAAYAGRAAQILMVGAPGCAPAEFWRHEYRRIPRPLWPWDEIESWKPAPTVFAAGDAGEGKP